MRFVITFSILIFFLSNVAISSDSLSVVSQDSIQLPTDTTATPSVNLNKVLIQEGPSFFEKLMADSGFPYVGVVLMFLIVVFVIFNFLSKTLNQLKEGNLSRVAEYEINETMATSTATKGAIKYIGGVLLIGYLVYIAIANTSMQGYTMEWLNLLIRWAHAVAGIMWIGASFYFVFLENNLNRTENVRDELAGNLWAIHGGGFYFLEKYKVAPKIIPKDLHWFKYEAYFTWLTGFSLLFVVYYMDAKAFLIDPSVADLSVPAAIGIGIGTLIFGWVLYDFMCKSPLIKRQGLFAVVGFIILTVIAYFLTHIFNSRAAFIHVGALLGTIMAWNVYFVIIPGQKGMVKAASTGRPLDPTLGQKAGQRSLHNNYITLPVIFIMISNHFPSTFGHQYNWIILMGIALTSAGIKHYWNLVERGIVKMYILIVSVVGLLSVALISSPLLEESIDNAIPVSFEEANEVIQARCVQCHSASPTDDQWTTAPNGVMFDTPDQIVNMQDKIMARAVRSKTMPQGNKTKMTEEERVILKRWILQGAKISE